MTDERADTSSPADVDRARELAGLMDRIQSDPGGKLDRILEELAAIRSTLDDVSARLAALEEPTTPAGSLEASHPPPGSPEWEERTGWLREKGFINEADARDRYRDRQ